MYCAADGLGRRRRIHPQAVIDWSGKTCGIDEKKQGSILLKHHSHGGDLLFLSLFSI